MADQTRNYQLTKPLESEFYDVGVQNDNMDKIDQALADQADGIRNAQNDLKKKADLDDSGKVPAEQLPNMDYETKGTAAATVKTHNEDEAAHPFLVGQIGTCVTAAQNAQTAADAALEAVSKIAFTINAIPTQSGTLTYTGSAQTPSWNSFDPNAMTIGGVTTGTNAGTYTATFTPKDKYQWADGTKTAKSVTWKINRASVSVPSQNGSLTYTGSEQAPSWSGYDTAKMTVGGTVKGTTAGSYNATFTPKANYQWTDGTTGAKTVQWKIGKAAGSLTLNRSSLSLNVSTKTGTITATKAGDGAVSATSSNTSVATVSVSGNTITVTAKGHGSATITVKVEEGTNHTAPANKTCSVSVTFPQSTLNSNSWATIKQASDAGAGANYWAVGDTKSITINGTVQGFNFSNLTINVFILGFNHNSSREGGNRIHFQIGKIGTTAVALCDSQYNSSGSGDGFRMNKSNTNSGGWNGSHMRKSVLGNSGTPTSPVGGSLMAALPSDLRAVMKTTTKYTDNTGGGSDNASYVTATTDYLFLLAEFEVFGTRYGANSAEQNFQLQYDYYKAGNSRVAYNHTAVSTAVWWWLRSPHYSYGGYFRVVYTDGSYNNINAYYSAGVRPGFSV